MTPGSRFICFELCWDSRELHSFPTRLSSDLLTRILPQIGLPYRKATSGGVAPPSRAHPDEPRPLLELPRPLLVRLHQRRLPQAIAAEHAAVHLLDDLRPAVHDHRGRRRVGHA